MQFEDGVINDSKMAAYFCADASFIVTFYEKMMPYSFLALVRIKQQSKMWSSAQSRLCMGNADH